MTINTIIEGKEQKITANKEVLLWLCKRLDVAAEGLHDTGYEALATSARQVSMDICDALVDAGVLDKL